MVPIRPNSFVLLVIEDSDEDFDTVAEAVALSEVTVEVLRATTGEAGLILLRELAPDRPTVVLMDLNTAGTDGRTALADVKSDVALKAIPVVVLSTSSSPKDIEFCYSVGANAYHVKPVRYPEHRQLVIEIARYWIGQVALHAGRTSS